MWIYSQTSGVLVGPHGSAYSGLYSGHGPGLNNPAEQSDANIGPIPAGTWTIGPPAKDDDTGPLSLLLAPDPATQTFGRTGFRIHGDSLKAPGERQASHGCIVAAVNVRVALRDSPDRTLLVVPHL